MQKISEFGVVGGNIEGPFGAEFGIIWLCTATVLDVIAGAPLVSVVDGKELADFGVLTSEHAKHANKVGALKESIISGFPDMIALHVAVIDYYLDNVVPEGGTFHVHVHRGKNMGSEHIAQIQRRLAKKRGVGVDELDPRLSFGYGYNPGELSTPGGKVASVYYSISLIVGFDPKYSSGTTFVPDVYTDFTEPPTYRDTPIASKNHLLATMANIDPIAVSGNLIVRGGKVAVLKGIFIPEDATRPVECRLAKY